MNRLLFLVAVPACVALDAYDILHLEKERSVEAHEVTALMSAVNKQLTNIGLRALANQENEEGNAIETLVQGELKGSPMHSLRTRGWTEADARPIVQMMACGLWSEARAIKALHDIDGNDADRRDMLRCGVAGVVLSKLQVQNEFNTPKNGHTNFETETMARGGGPSPSPTINTTSGTQSQQDKSKLTVVTSLDTFMPSAYVSHAIETNPQDIPRLLSSACLELLSTWGEWTCTEHGFQWALKGKTTFNALAGTCGKMPWLVPTATDDVKLFPQLNSAQLRASLGGKWIMLIGDSVARMHFDYLMGQLTGDWDSRKWPTERFENAGPPHPESCTMAGTHWFDLKADHAHCMYDSFVYGCRVTFIYRLVAKGWEKDAFAELMTRNVGVPDLLILDDGPWEVGAVTVDDSRGHSTYGWAKPNEDLVDSVDQTLHTSGGTLRKEWPHAYKVKSGAWRQTIKVWLSVVDYAVSPPHGVYAAGARRFIKEKKDDWIFFNRTRMAIAEEDIICDGVHLEVALQAHGGILHPMGTVLPATIDMYALSLVHQ